VVLLDPGLNGMPGLSNVDPTTFAWVAVGTSCFQVKVMLDRVKETGDICLQFSCCVLLAPCWCG
jgi:hypothetical protein